MADIIMDDFNLRDLPPRERFSKCESILKESIDESFRWDAVWIAGELAESPEENELFQKVADLMVWVLQNDNNGVVKHEACYQIAARNMREKIPDLVNTAIYDDSIVARHEAVEALGLMRAFETAPALKKFENDPNPDVRETVAFVLKRFGRLKNKGDYVPSTIL